jgi:ElaB/YqjD/DUF883 family membrane-anchored ribosome-binding protein
MSTTNDRLGKQALAVKEDLQEMGETVRDAAQEKLGQLREHASGYYEQGRDKVQGVVHAFEQSVGQRPLTSLLIAAGVGLLLGRFWSWMRR